MVNGAVFSLGVVTPSPLSSGAGALAAGGLSVGSRVNAEVRSTLTVAPGLADMLPIWEVEESRSAGGAETSGTSGNCARNSGVRGAIPERFSGGKEESGGKPENV